MIKLKKEPEPIDVPVKHMVDGDVAIITSWSVEQYIGTIVQRYGDVLMSLGKPSSRSWHEILKSANSQLDCRVRILQPGTELVIE